jgi:hypothetical protein
MKRRDLAGFRQRMQSSFVKMGVTPETASGMLREQLGPDDDVRDQLRAQGHDDEEIDAHLQSIGSDPEDEPDGDGADDPETAAAIRKAQRAVAELVRRGRRMRQEQGAGMSFAVSEPISEARADAISEEFVNRPGGQLGGLLRQEAGKHRARIAKLIREVQDNVDGRETVTDAMLASEVNRRDPSLRSGLSWAQWQLLVRTIAQDMGYLMNGSGAGARSGYAREDETSTGLSLSLNSPERADAIVEEIFANRSGW